MHVGGIGSIEKRGPNTWRIRLAVGRDPQTGRYRQVSRTIHGSKSDAYRAREELRQEIEGGLERAGERMMFLEFSQQFEARRKACGRFKSATLNTDHMIINRLNKYLGATILRDINAYTVANVQAKMVEDGFTPTMLYQSLHKLNQVLEDAARLDLIKRNPCERISLPKPTRKGITALSAQEARSLLGALERREAQALALAAIEPARGVLELSRVSACRLALSTGMRRGEVLGLTWKHVDFEKASLRIVQQFTAEGRLQEPKTKSGMRSVSLDGRTLSYLKTWKRRQADLLRRVRVQATEETPVAGNSMGRFPNVSDFNSWWKVFREEAGFKNLRFHDLRHTQATLLIGNGVDIKTVQSRLGHSRAATTLDTYASALPGNDRTAANLFGSILENASQPHHSDPIQTAI